MSATASVMAKQEPLTLPDAVRRALAYEDRIVAAHANVQRGEIRVMAASADFRPVVTPTASGALGQRDLANQSVGLVASQKLPSGTGVQGGFTSQSSRNQIGTYYFTETSLFVTQPLLRGFGRDFARRPIEGAEAGLRDARRQLSLVQQQVLLQTTEAYLRIVGQLALQRAADRAVDRATALRDESMARLKSGRVSQLDTLRAEQLLAQAQAGRLDAAAAIDDAKDQLRRLLRLAAAEEVLVVADVPPVTLPPSESEALASALANRPEVAAATDALQRAEMAVRTARSAKRPQLDLRAGVIRQQVADRPLGGVGLRDFQFAAYTAFSVPLFDVQRDAELQTALVERRQLAHDAETALMGVTLDVRRAYRELTRAEQSLTLARSAVDLARREVDVAQLRFSRGLSSNLDVITAEAGLLAAQSRVVVADSQITLSRLSVLAATGTLSPDAAFP